MYDKYNYITFYFDYLGANFLKSKSLVYTDIKLGKTIVSNW